MIGVQGDINKNPLHTGNKATQEANAAKNKWNYTLRLCHCMYQVKFIFIYNEYANVLSRMIFTGSHYFGDN